MIIGFNLGVQKVNSNAYDSFLNEEILYYLNKAESEYIRDQYIYLRGMYNNQRNPELYKKAQEAIENLRTIIRSSSISANINAHSFIENGHTVSLDEFENFNYYIRSQAKPEADSSWIRCDLVNHIDINKYIFTESNKPMFRDFKVFMEFDSINILRDIRYSGINSFGLTYLMKTPDMVESNPTAGETTTSILPDHTHEDIVNLAVDMVLQDIKSQRPVKPPQVDPEVD